MVVKLTEFALQRKDVIRKLDNNRDFIFEHILKCCIYGNQLNCLKHWIEGEIAPKLCVLAKYKAKNKSLTKEDYLNHTFLYACNELSDMSNSMQLFQIDNRHNKDYPDFEFSDELVQYAFNCFIKIANACSVLMIDGEKYNNVDYAKVIYEILDNT